MPISDEQLLAIAQSRGLVDAQPAATRTVPNPAGAIPPPVPQDVLRTEAKPTTRTDRARAALRGLTMGISDPLGAAIATVPASFGSGKPVGEVYDDIRGTIQHQADVAYEANPKVMDTLEGLGAVAGVLGTAGPALAGGLARASSNAAIRRGAARVAPNSTRVNLLNPKGGAVLEAAGPTPIVAGVTRGGRPVKVANLSERLAAAPVAEEVAKKSLFQRALREAEYAAGGAAVGEIVSGDPGAGAVLGALAPGLINNPLGRWGLSRAMKRVAGDKARAFTYMATHPATRREAKRAAKIIEKSLKRGK